jgi:hypothetical protein
MCACHESKQGGTYREMLLQTPVAVQYSVSLGTGSHPALSGPPLQPSSARNAVQLSMAGHRAWWWHCASRAARLSQTIPNDTEQMPHCKGSQ